MRVVNTSPVPGRQTVTLSAAEVRLALYEWVYRNSVVCINPTIGYFIKEPQYDKDTTLILMSK